MPGFAVLAAPAHVGEDVDPTHFQPLGGHRRESEARRDVEAAVAGEDRRGRAVARESFAVRDEHRNARPVFACEEDLFGSVGGRIEFYGRLVVHRACAACDVESIDYRRRGEAAERIVRDFVVTVATEAPGVTDPRQGDLTQSLPSAIVFDYLRMRVAKVLREKHAAGASDPGERRIALGNDRTDLARLADVDGDQLAVRRAIVRGDKEERAVAVDDLILRLLVWEQFDWLRFRRLKVAIEYAVLVALAEVVNAIAPVLSFARTEKPVLVVGARIDERVGRLRRPDLVEIYLLIIVDDVELRRVARRGVGVVVEAAVVATPRRARELRPSNRVRQILAGRDVSDVPGLPI